MPQSGCGLDYPGLTPTLELAIIVPLKAGSRHIWGD